MSSATWKKLPATGGFVHCNCCPAREEHAHIDDPIDPGFGGYSVTRGDEGIEVKPAGDYATVGDVEALAAADPEHDWQISIDAPLYSATYQRQAAGLWVLVEKGDGFA